MISSTIIITSQARLYMRVRAVCRPHIFNRLEQLFWPTVLNSCTDTAGIISNYSVGWNESSYSKHLNLQGRWGVRKTPTLYCTLNYCPMEKIDSSILSNISWNVFVNQCNECFWTTFLEMKRLWAIHIDTYLWHSAINYNTWL